MHPCRRSDLWMHVPRSRYRPTRKILSEISTSDRWAADGSSSVGQKSSPSCFAGTNAPASMANVTSQSVSCTSPRYTVITSTRSESEKIYIVQHKHRWPCEKERERGLPVPATAVCSSGDATNAAGRTPPSCRILSVFNAKLARTANYTFGRKRFNLKTEKFLCRTKKLSFPPRSGTLECPPSVGPPLSCSAPRNLSLSHKETRMLACVLGVN